MESQNFEVSCEVLFEQLNNTELQEIVGGAWYSFITSCFKPEQKIVPMQTYKLPSGAIELPAGDYLAVFAT